MFIRKIKNIFLDHTVLVFFIFFLASLLLSLISSIEWRYFYENSYSVWYIIKDSFYQAGISAIISCFLGLVAARCVFLNPDHIFSRILEKITPLYFVMPSLMILLCMVGVYGNNGFLNMFLRDMGQAPIHNMIYGLHGVIFTHVMINFPLVLWVIIQHYKKIAPEYWRISEALQFTALQKWQIIEFPLLKKSFINCFTLVFLYCFMSFAIVLLLGGGHVKTFELSIYQAFYLDFNPEKAARLGFTQFICLLPLLLLLSKEHFSLRHQIVYRPRIVRNVFYYAKIAFVAALSLLYLFPIIWFIKKMLQNDSWNILAKMPFWESVSYSLILSACSVFVAFVFIILLIYQSSASLYRITIQRLYHVSVLIFLAFPPFLLLSAYYGIKGDFKPTLLTLIIVQSLLLLPLLWRFMHDSIAHNFSHNHLIMRACHMHFGKKIILMLQANKRILVNGCCFAFALSLGDFSVIALLGNNDIVTIPLYLYRNISHYKFDDAIFVGLILISLQFICFLCMQKK